MLILVGQIALGGWVSANYAALACTELPVCEGDWYSQLEFAGAFSIPEADNYEFGTFLRRKNDNAHRSSFWGIGVGAYLCWFVSNYTPFMSDRIRTSQQPWPHY